MYVELAGGIDIERAVIDKYQLARCHLQPFAQRRACGQACQAHLMRVDDDLEQALKAVAGLLFPPGSVG